MNISWMPWPKTFLGRFIINLILVLLALVFWPLTLAIGFIVFLFLFSRWLLRRSQIFAAREAVNEVVRAPLWRRPIVVGSLLICGLFIIFCAAMSGSHTSQLSAVTAARIENQTKIDEHRSWGHTGEFFLKSTVTGAVHGIQGDVKGAVVNGIQMITEEVNQGRALQKQDQQLTAYQQQILASKSHSDDGIAIGLFFIFLICAWVTLRILRARKRLRLQTKT